MADVSAPPVTTAFEEQSGTSRTWRTISLGQVALGTLLVIATLGSIWLLVSLRYVIILLFLGIVLATALSPIVERLRQWGMPRNFAVWLTFGLFFLLLAGLIRLFVPFFVEQLNNALRDLPAGYNTIRATLASSSSRVVQNIATQLPTDPLVALNGDQGTALGGSLAAALPRTGRALALAALVLLLSYYWLYYRTLTVQSLVRLLPIDMRNDAVNLWNQIEEKVGSFVRGLAILSAIIGVLSGIGFYLIGLPFAVSIAAIAAVLEVVPYIGPTLTLVIAGLVGLSVSPEMAMMAVGVSFLIQLAESTFIVPRVMDKAVGVRPVVSLLAFAIFGELFGLLGGLLAVPLAAAIQVLIDRFILTAPPVQQLSVGGRDSLALLRYQTQDLANDLRQLFRSDESDIDPVASNSQEDLEALLTDLDNLLATAQEGQAT